MKKFKICFAILSCCFFIFLSSFPVFAADTAKIPVPSFPSDYDKSVYPYYVYHFQQQNASSIKVYFIASNKPFTTNSSHTSISFSDGCFFASIPIRADGSQIMDWNQGFMTGFRDVDITGYPGFYSGFVASNFDVKDVDGNVLFRKPLVTDQTVAPLISQTRGNLAVIVGGSLCLVVLGISLVMLSKRLHQFLQ